MPPHQRSSRRPQNPLQRLALALIPLLAVAACTTAPSTPKPSFEFVTIPPTVNAELARNLEPQAAEIPPGWLSSELTVSLGEQDLFERLRTGFGLEDVEHATVDREEQWYASHPDYLDRTFRRGERYLYYIVSQLEERHMPRELALLPVVESAFIPDALSHAKAAGLWQFIPSTGKRYGLKQNAYYDGRRDVVESTRAALDYLEFLYEEFDDWLLAVAAYNTGEFNVARAIERNRARNKPTDFFSLDLPKETRAYVPKLMAMRRIIAEPARYGLEFGALQNQPYFVTVDIGGPIDLEIAAELAGMSKEDFLALNPGFNYRITDPNGPHRLLVPVENEEAFLQKLADLPDEQRVTFVTYRVRKGETLKSISRKTGMTMAQLRSLNNLKSSKVRPGQELLLQSKSKLAASKAPVENTVHSDATHIVRSGETLWSIAKRNGIDPQTLAAANSIDDSDNLSIGQRLVLPAAATLASTNAAKTLEPLTYTVRRGDTLTRIAQLFKVRVADIMQWNKLRSAAALKAGQRLTLYVDDAQRLGG